MRIRKKIDAVRQAIVWSLTKNIGLSHRDAADSAPRRDVNKILINRPNHRLGNLLLLTPLLQEVGETFPGAQIDLFVKGKLAPILFSRYTNVSQIITLPARPFTHLLPYFGGWIRMRKGHYDLVFNAVNHSSSGRLSTRLANADLKCYGDLEEEMRACYPDYLHAAKFPVYSFRSYLQRMGLPTTQRPVARPDLKLSEGEINGGRKCLHDLVPNGKRTICLFTYATGEKCYSKPWWEQLYQKLRAAFDSYNLIEVLPVENVSQLSFAIPSFYSRDIREIGSLIANTDLFIGADSGMMHLASAVHTNTVGLFKITDPATFGPYNDRSVSINTNTGGVDDWIKIIRNIPDPG